MYEPRIYRTNQNTDLISFEVIDKETDLFVKCELNCSLEIKNIVQKYRRDLESFIKNEPLFELTFKPFIVDKNAPEIIQKMSEVTRITGVGPMASVAGAVAEFVGKDIISKFNCEIIIENGGDIFLYTKKERSIGIYTKNPKFDDNLFIKIDPKKTPLGICTSSGKIGPSVSLGKADSVTIISSSAALSDAVATGVGNIVVTANDIEKAIDFGKNIDGVLGIIIICEDKLGIWGDVNLGAKK